ncbi:hypothetical protein [Flammeovirga sp. EKP202]|uniref:hypothetical protein n=1 Tax=Flammeovirga sp. EKP202 TaxID=2770592 RepID=UPI00165F409F|nr:hypothetical protein [Flammeovirga sp. EKP202]MBD0401048.1 hypothetical protein [Flammeovirga sp. EKP202]
MSTLTQQEKLDKHDERINYNLMLQCKEKLKQGRIILFAIAATQLFGIFGGLSANISFVVVLYSVILISFAILGFLVTKMPKKAVLAGLAIYLTLEVLGLLIGASLSFFGLLIKVAIVSGLIKAYMAAKDAVELQVKLDAIEERKRQRKLQGEDK